MSPGFVTHLPERRFRMRTLPGSLLLSLALALCFSDLEAQELPRRPFLGIRMETVTPELAETLGMKPAKGVLLQQVFTGSTAEAARMEQGDVLLMVGRQPVNSPDEVIAALRAFQSGQAFTYQVWRKGKTVEGQGTLRSWAQEQYAGFSMDYGAVQAGESLLRTITSRPKAPGRSPAVLFIQGIGCYSLDTPLDTSRSETQLLNQLTRMGFVTMRVDKSGMGDSQGEPCSSIDFMEELEGYVQALKRLKSLDYVDPSKVFLIGHSMGGVMAPMAARQEPVAGIIAYGTIGSNFLEYLISSRRTIAESYGMTPAEKDAFIRENCECAAMFYLQKMSAEEASRIKPGCRDLLTALELRSRGYNDQLYELNLPAIWQEFTGRLLAVWGKSDYISTRRDHEFIAEAVNHQHSGHAVFLELPDSDHGMHLAAGFAEARTNPGPYNRAAGKTFADWMKKVMTDKP